MAATALSLPLNNGLLTVNGDPFGVGSSDTFVIDVNGAGGVVVTLDGDTTSFDPGRVTSIVVDTGGGTNSVFVRNEAVGVSLTINGGGKDHVAIGSHGSVQGIRGWVAINNEPSRADLVIDDSADTVARVASVSSSSVSGLAPSPIIFRPNALSYLGIYGGSGGNTFYVFDTPSTFDGSSAGYTWVDSGAGNDTVNVFATAGGPLAGGLYVNGHNGQDFVRMGSDHGNTLGHGTLANIKGFVYALNATGRTILEVDDGADAVARTVALTGNSLTGLSTGAIYWVPTASGTGGVTDLYINGSAGASTYNVTNSPALIDATVVYTGAGNDTVNITGTTGFFTADNTGGYDSVYVGNGTVAGINGVVNVTGRGATYLYVQDYNDTTAHHVTLTASTLTGLATGGIEWDATSKAMGGVTYLSIVDGAGSSTFDIKDTPKLSSFTNLATGAGNDVVIIGGTTGDLFVNNLAGEDFVYVDNGTLANLNGNVTISGNGAIDVIVMDENDTTARSATLSATSLTGLSRGAIRWVASSSPMGGVTYLGIEGSAAASTYTVADTPTLYRDTYLVLGAADDAVFITGTTGALHVRNPAGRDTVVLGRQPPATSGGKVAGIKGLVDVGGLGSVAMTVDDSGDTTGRSARLSSNGLTGLAPAPITFGTNVSSLAINAGSGNDTLTVASTPPSTVVLFNGGPGNDTLVGPSTTNTWFVTGTNAGSLDNFLLSASVEGLVGGTGVDTFIFQAGKVGSIAGGGAPAGKGDWLDYAFDPVAVSVNLATGQATGVSGLVSGIQDVFGSNHGNTLTGNAGGNILIGGDGADTIVGGSGRSVLIGGKGNDVVKGGAGDDIVIGGPTRYEQGQNEAALMSILSEWQSADSYALRISKLGGGTFPLLGLGTTVLDDGGADRLTGGGGMDWFFTGAHATVTDLQVEEKVN